MRPDDPNDSTRNAFDPDGPDQPDENESFPQVIHAAPVSEEPDQPDEQEVLNDFEETDDQDDTITLAPPVDEVDTVIVEPDEVLQTAEELAAPDDVSDDAPSPSVVRFAAPPEPGPVSAAPPRIVAETPIGGKAPRLPVIPARSFPPDEPPVAHEHEPAPPVPEHDEPEPAPVADSPVMAGESPAEPVTPAEADTPAETPAEAPPAPPVGRFRRDKPPIPVAPSPPAEDTVAADEWDDAVSPELAAILFQPRERPAAREMPSVVDKLAEPVEDKELPAAEPVTLMDTAEAQTLPITAEGLSSPPPGRAPEGKVRYTRLEEPLGGDKGQRTVETWEYLGKGLPALSGRLVKKIRAELRDYADGSWRWHYERHYSDRGFDRRDVRANTDRTFIERTDAIKKKDPATGKSIRRKERAALILSGPVVKERRGFLSRLLDHDDAAEKAWRAATKYEARQARRRGGDAF